MDPFSLTFSIVVVVLVLIIIYVVMKGDFIRIYSGHVIVKSHANRVQQIHLKDTGCSTESTLTVDVDTITATDDFSQMRATETDESELFITNYDHVQAQHQENWNFQILAYQLWSEFYGYMQYALTQASATAIPVPEPIDFQTLQMSYVEKHEPLANLHVEHYAVYEQKALQEADAEIERQATGARLTDPTRPWSGQPYGHRTRSLASIPR